MNKGLVFSMAALAVVTAASAWVSVSLPARATEAARAQTTLGLSLTSQVLTQAGPRCSKIKVAQHGLVAKSHLENGRCTASVVFPLGSQIPATIQGAHLQVTQTGGHQECQAFGGHGAGAMDFPTQCHYQPTQMLI